MKDLKSKESNVLEFAPKNEVLETREELMFRSKREREEFIENWHKENGHLLEDLVELDTPYQEVKAIEQFYMSVGLYEGRRKSSGKNVDIEGYGDRGISIDHERAGYIEYECDCCGEIYSYKPDYCSRKDDRDGFACGCKDFNAIHGPFENVCMLHRDTIQCGDSQGLPRNSHFEDGSNFSDIAVIDESGLFMGYASEENAVDHSPAMNSSEKKYFQSRVEYRVEQRKQLDAYLKRFKHYAGLKMRGISEEECKDSLVKLVGRFEKSVDKNGRKKVVMVDGLLQYGIKYYFSDWKHHYKYGYAYSKGKVYSKDNTMQISPNTLLMRELTEYFIDKWEELNGKRFTKRIESNDYERCWKKWEDKLMKMPDCFRDKADLIYSGWLEMDSSEIVKVLQHAYYLKRCDGKNHIEYGLYKVLQKYQRGMGA